MIEQSPGYVPDPATRPTQVRWAFGLWLLSGLLLVVLGVISLVAEAFQSRWNLGVLAVEVLIGAVGLAYILLARKATCVPQWRGSLAALTFVVVVMVLVLTIGFQSPGLAVVLAVTTIGFAGTVLAYRPKADAWFNGSESDEQESDAREDGRRDPRDDDPAGPR